ncbi:MAG: CYTH domain-containing protein [Patescibacteria group bacterium]|nr:CYTH domain-containing protein [Patescibacteria group bacterium]MDE1945004.1 CYTH domain-containing protein [Patescibacteria group bacterium]MDE2057484.1 CYTH domain-containing protein [Patescibacteria group bacterium]
MQNREIEVRFLEVDAEDLKRRLAALGATDEGEDMLEEVIIYDKDFKWRDDGGKLLRLRTKRGTTVLTYKHHIANTATDTEEIETIVRSSSANSPSTSIPGRAYRRIWR